MPLTASERAELDTAIERQTAVVDNLSAEINNMREKTGPAFDRSKWTELTLDYSVADRQLQNLRDKLKDEASVSEGMTRTGIKNAIEGSPTTRFINAAARCGDGNQGLEEWEITAQRAIAEQNGFENIRKPGDFVLPLRAYGSTQAADLIQTDVMPQIVEALVNFGGAKQMAQRITTSGGNPLQVPKADESDQEGVMVAELATAPTQGDIAADETTLNAYTFTSKGLNISKQSIADTGANGFDLVGYQLRQAARRLGRAENKYLTTGTGTNQPQGIVNAAGNGVQINATGGGASVVYADLVDLVGAIDDAYLQGMEMDVDGSSAETGGQVGFMFHRNFETVLMKLTDGDSRPLWAPGLSSIAGSAKQNMLLGYPYAINYHFDSNLTGANKVVAVFGNFSYYMVRSVDSILIRLFDDSGTADTNSVKILGYSRCDGRSIAAGSANGAFIKLRAKA